MMETSILNQLPFDPGFLILGLIGLVLILLIFLISTMVQLKSLTRKYDYFMRGKDAESMEEIILNLSDEIKELKSQDRANKDVMRTLSKNVKGSYQKFGMVKYNAFKGMGGNLSFAFAMLDQNNTGFILNSVHSREGCYLYMKEVDRGQTDVVLGNEEQEALEQALGYVEKKPE